MKKKIWHRQLKYSALYATFTCTGWHKRLLDDLLSGKITGLYWLENDENGFAPRVAVIKYMNDQEFTYAIRCLEHQSDMECPLPLVFNDLQKAKQAAEKIITLY